MGLLREKQAIDERISADSAASGVIDLGMPVIAARTTWMGSSSASPPVRRLSLGVNPNDRYRLDTYGAADLCLPLPVGFVGLGGAVAIAVLLAFLTTTDRRMTDEYVMTPEPVPA